MDWQTSCELHAVNAGKNNDILTLWWAGPGAWVIEDMGGIVKAGDQNPDSGDEILNEQIADAVSEAESGNYSASYPPYTLQSHLIDDNGMGQEVIEYLVSAGVLVPIK